LEFSEGSSALSSADRGCVTKGFTCSAGIGVGRFPESAGVVDWSERKAENLQDAELAESASGIQLMEYPGSAMSAKVWLNNKEKFVVTQFLTTSLGARKDSFFSAWSTPWSSINLNQVSKVSLLSFAFSESMTLLQISPVAKTTVCTAPKASTIVVLEPYARSVNMKAT
jgi:hypothetical protein